MALWEQSGLAASRDTAIPERMDFSGVHPALKQLYENVAAILAANDFTLLELRHLEYRERYRVAYGKARVQMDFLYNNKGQVPILSFAPEPGCEKSDLDHVKNVVTQALYGADSTPEKRQEAPHV